MKLLELFGGIGACTKAFEKLGIDFEIADYVEIDKYAVMSYNAIHGTDFKPQDISKWDKDIDADLIMHGSPCQDFSLSGKQAGGDEGSGTRSSLMYESIRIIEKIKPKYVIWENVKNVIAERHQHNFYKYLMKMNDLGYVNYYQILNAKDYGIPQNRERMFTVSIRKDVDTAFQFPQKRPLKMKLFDMLEDDVDEKYYLSEKMLKYVMKGGTKRYYLKLGIDMEIARPLTATMHKMHRAGSDNYVSQKFIKIRNANKKGFENAYAGDCVNLQFPNSLTRRGRVGHDVSQTLQCSDSMGVVTDEMKIRKLTPREAWKLMGFDDQDYEKASKYNSDTQLYKQAGNSIVVDVLMAILTNLIVSPPHGATRQMTIFDYLEG